MTTLGPLHKPGRTAKPLVQIEKLTKFFPVRRGWFGATHLVRAVNGVSLYIRQGETLGLIGEGGAGKTTLGRTALRIIEPTFGRIVFAGQDVTPLSQAELRPLRRHMQMVFQDPAASLHPRMSVQDTLTEALRIHGLAQTRSEHEDRCRSLLEGVGMAAATMQRYPHELDAGQHQQLALARALAINPKFVVCDEPISALDPTQQARIANLLLDLQEKSQLGVLYISHDLRMIAYVSHRVAVMYLGRVVEMAPTELLYAKRSHPYTRALLGANTALRRARSWPEFALQGDPPNPFEQPTGCALHPRCPRAVQGWCDTEEPELRELDPGTHHRVACHNPFEEAP